MKPIALFIGVAGVALVSSCAWNQDVVVDPVGPPKPSKMAASKEGTLIVYSSWEVSNDDYEHEHHTPFSICSSSGELLKKVRNWNNGILEDPTPVALPEGDYQIKAHAQGYRTVTVPVRIEAGLTTTVYLDDSTATSAKSPGKRNAVTLPDGRVVGWRADPSQ